MKYVWKLIEWENGKDTIKSHPIKPILASPQSLTTTRPVGSTVRPSTGIDATSKSIVDHLLVSHANPIPPILMFFYGSTDFGDYSLSLNHGEDFGDPKVNYTQSSHNTTGSSTMMERL
jgi:hypothetical protein